MAIWSSLISNIAELQDRSVVRDGTSGIADLALALSGAARGWFDAPCDEKAVLKSLSWHGCTNMARRNDLAPDAMYQRIRIAGTSVLRRKAGAVA